MIDTRAVAQEVQDQLLAAVQRGQDQMRKSQDQMRKSREAVADVIRTGNRLAKAVRPNIPALPVHVPTLDTLPNPAKLRATAHELTDHVVAAQRSLTDKAIKAAGPLTEHVVATQRSLTDKAIKAAGPLTEHVVATQRSLTDKAIKAARQRDLAGKAFQAASPLVAEGLAKLTKAVGSLQDVRRFGRSGTASLDAVTAEEVVAPAEARVETRPADAPTVEAVPAETAADTTPADAVAAEASAPLAKPTATKPRTAKASSATAGSGKTASTRKAASTPKTPGTDTGRAAKK